ncbi:MAG TPA: hypothetical protein VFI22_19645, partial [Thermomicrobiales bacterium]|nr:hypothetical protein [Thermomicrobiales bacterium]
MFPLQRPACRGAFAHAPGAPLAAGSFQDIGRLVQEGRRCRRFAGERRQIRFGFESPGQLVWHPLAAGDRFRVGQQQRRFVEIAGSERDFAKQAVDQRVVESAAEAAQGRAMAIQAFPVAKEQRDLNEERERLSRRILGRHSGQKTFQFRQRVARQTRLPGLNVGDAKPAEIPKQRARPNGSELSDGQFEKIAGPFMIFVNARQSATDEIEKRRRFRAGVRRNLPGRLFDPAMRFIDPAANAAADGEPGEDVA